VVEWFYDAAVKGADAVTSRPGSSAMLDRIAGNGVRSIIVESPDRFARDLAVQVAGHDYLKGLGVALIPASAPDFFLEDTPTAVLVRQVLGAIAQFDKATMVAKLKAARDRKRKIIGKVEGRKSYIEREGGLSLVARVKALRDQRPRLSLREIAAELEREGSVTAKGKRYSASAVRSMLKSA
jgi:DNA invertase Pin-like site-specific DNA recombinase